MFFGYTEEEMLGCTVVGTILPESERRGRIVVCGSLIRT
jgi:hypothetical protein